MLHQPPRASAPIPPAAPRVRSKTLLRWCAASDILALCAGFIYGWLLAVFVNNILLHRTFAHSITQYSGWRLGQFLAVGAGVIAWFHHTGHYRVRMPFWLEAKKIVYTTAFALLVDGFFQFASRQDFSRLWLAAGWLFSALFMLALRAVVRRTLKRRGMYTIPTLLVGSGATAKYVRAALQSDPALGYAIVSEVGNIGIAFLESHRSWEELCARHKADYVILALDGHELGAAEQPLAQLMRETLPFSIAPPVRHMPVLGMMPQYLLNHEVLLLTRASGLDQPVPRGLKRAMDITVSASMLLLLSPVMLTLAWLVRRDGGNAFYGHTRLGIGGKPFACLKFRSMVMNGDEILAKHLAENPAARREWEATRKLQNDPRVTRTGQFLRKSSLDELPQLFNVLRGEMSLVGPRPIVTDETVHYDRDIAHYYRVRPGITGLWQVSGRNDVSYAERVHMDSWYVRNWSLWHDVAILFKTVPALLKRSGAY